jgi:carboxyl-terminal processing protease
MVFAMRSSALLRFSIVLAAAAGASVLSLRGLSSGAPFWAGFPEQEAMAAGARSGAKKGPYDLTQLRVVNEVLRAINERYVDPKRVRPQEMLRGALDFVQRDVAQVLVTYDEGNTVAHVKADSMEKSFPIDDVVAPWDVAARLREVFAFLQKALDGSDVDLREVEYAASNGMLHTLDPHSILLTPKQHRDMKVQTRGQFGGLGIVISIRDQQLTVMNPMPGTPAHRAGIRRYDRITRIDNESTTNLGLNEAVSRLRGAPNTKVTVWIHRDGPDGWEGAKAFELTREVIRVRSIESKLLEGNVGYVRLKTFMAASLSADMQKALDDMKRQGPLKGVVLDLRGNGGGLLDQAVRVVDAFVSEGPILATVGKAEGRDEHAARRDGTEPNYPMVVLVDGESASASEIVTGALKNHDRAIVVGTTTFGKGSVQAVLEDMPDETALKITTAQYLTEPGDVSIQGVGVMPDIELDPMTVDPVEMDLVGKRDGLRERDLSRRLVSTRTRGEEKPFDVLRYVFPLRERLELRERGYDDDGVRVDFPIRFARDLVTRVPSGTRTQQLQSAKGFLDQIRAAQVSALADDLKKYAIDWSDAPANVPAVNPPQAPAGIEVTVETTAANGEVRAGEAADLRVTVTNKSKEHLHRLFGVTKSDAFYFNERELVFGHLKPGETKVVNVPLGACTIEGRKPGSSAALPAELPRNCRIPKDALSRSDGIVVRFEEARGRAPGDATIRVATRALERPVFAYEWAVIDDRRGNGDGRVQKGEAFTMALTVRNVGKGPSLDAQANLRNLSGDGLLLRDARFDLSNLKPDEARRFAFTFDVDPQLDGKEARLELVVSDADLRESVAERITLPIEAPLEIAPVRASFESAKPVALRSSTAPDGRVIGLLPPKTSALVVGTAGAFWKVALEGTQFAFVRKDEGTDAPKPGNPVQALPPVVHAPPALELAAPNLVVRDANVTVSGKASDTRGIVDTFVFVGGRKVYYASNKKAANGQEQTFSAQLPLKPGANVVTVVSRHSQETTTRRAFVIRRDGPNGELLATQKHNGDLDSLDDGGDE